MCECHRNDVAIIQSIPNMQCVFIFFLLTVEYGKKKAVTALENRNVHLEMVSADY